MKKKSFYAAIVMMALSSTAGAQGQGVDACYASLGNGQASDALAQADKVLGSEANNREALLCKGRAHVELKQYDNGIAALQAADKLSAKPADHVIALLMIGNVQKEAGKRAEAVTTYNDALTTAKERNDKTLQRLALNVMGEAEVEAGETQTGLQYYLQAADLAANDNERAENYGQIASTHSKLGNHEQAIEYQVKAMLMQERSGEPDDYAHAGLELGRYYIAAKDYSRAEKSIGKILKFAQDNGSAYWEARSNYYLGLNKAGQGDIAAARTLLLDAHHNARRIGATTLAGEIGEATLKLPAQ